MPLQLRQLFASILVFCQLANIKYLWDKYFDALTKDYDKNEDSKELNITKLLVFIKKYLIQNRLSLSNFSELSKPNYSLLEKNQQQLLIADEQNYNQDEIEKILQDHKGSAIYYVISFYVLYNIL